MSYQKIPTSRYENLGGINEKASKYLTGIMEFLNLVNWDMHVPGAVTKRPGSTQYAASGTSGAIIGLNELKRLNGASKIVMATSNGLFSLNRGSTPISIAATFVAQAVDTEMFVDWMWIGGASSMLKYNGTNVYAEGLPTPGTLVLAGSTAAGQSTGFFIYTQYGLGLVNSRGFYGPIGVVSAVVNGSASGGLSLITITNLHNVIPSPTYTVADYTGIFGATAIAVYRRDSTVSSADVVTKTFYRLTDIDIGSSRFTDSFGNTSLIGANVFKTQFREPNTWVADLAIDPGVSEYGTTLPLIAPRLLEIHQNSMFYSGHTRAPSNIYFSEIGDPETVEPDFSLEVRTNDGDIVRGMKAFGSQLLIFKENSFHKVVGDNPDNYELVEISTEYGALNNKCAVTFQNRCFFLDPKGVVEYDGSLPQVVSDRMEQTFRRMNLSAARDTAVAVHYDFRDQVWFAFPVDGATTNNMLVVYNYKTNAWYKYEGFQPASLLRAEGGLNTKTVFFGDYSGMVNYMGTSLYSDNGRAFTGLAQPGFIQPQGQSVEALFRRLWMDVEPVSGGITGVISVQLLSDMSNTGITTMPIYQNQFQSRLEFGVQAKAMGFIFTHSHVSLPCQINGWAVAHRWLRSV